MGCDLSAEGVRCILFRKAIGMLELCSEQDERLARLSR